MKDFTDIVVGAGSSGCTVAGRLAEDPDRSVLLIEAGPDYPNAPDDLPDDMRWGGYPAYRCDWGFDAKPVPERPRLINYTRGKAVGGTSAINTCIALRPDPRDMEDWVQLGNDRWDWDSVLPYLIELERDQDFGGPLHGSEGPIPIVRWADSLLTDVSKSFIAELERLGYAGVDDFNQPRVSGAGVLPMNLEYGSRVSAAVGYLAGVRGRPTLEIRAETMVERILIEDGRAVGVVLTDGSEVRADNVIVSAGAIQTPGVLCRSGIGPADVLADLGVEQVVDLPGVGQNLRDHAAAGVVMAPRPGVCDMKNGVCQAILRYTAPGSKVGNDMQLYLYNQVDLKDYAQEMKEAVGGPMALIVANQLSAPFSTGTVTPRTMDPAAEPDIELNFMAHPEDRRRLVDGLRLAWDIAQSGAIQEYAQATVAPTQATIESDRELEEFLEESLNTGYHPVGTAKMGPASDSAAVVDQRLNVHGVSHLKVADASVMPTLVRANTNLTCIMIGERLADFIQEEG